MKTKKPKRIRVEARTYIMMSGEAERRYWIRQSDIRALAKQMADDFCHAADCHMPETSKLAVLYALKRAGMTPGKGTQ